MCYNGAVLEIAGRRCERPRPGTGKDQFPMQPQYTTKVCSRCKRELPAAAFNKCKDSKSGLASYCRECQHEAFAKFYADNHDHCLTRRKEYYQAHAEESREKRRIYYRLHHARALASLKKWRQHNPDKVRAADKRHYQRTKGATIALVARWQSAHREQSNGYKRKWLKEHPLKGREFHHRRRAREAAAAVGTVDLNAIWLRDHGICHICGLPVDRANAHFDHVIPLAKGGAHSMDNIKVSHATCNLRKGAK